MHFYIAGWISGENTPPSGPTTFGTNCRLSSPASTERLRRESSIRPQPGETEGGVRSTAGLPADHAEESLPRVVDHVPVPVVPTRGKTATRDRRRRRELSAIQGTVRTSP